MFIRESINRHGDEYTYDNANYIDTYTKITITCREHGDFKHYPRYHISGAGCPMCSVVRRRTEAYDKFIINAVKLYGGAYKYPNDGYHNAHTKITITCREHGEFKQTPASHLAGNSGCPSCGLKRSNQLTSLTDFTSTIYLIKLDNPSESYYKIGISQHINNRMRSITHGAKSNLRGVIECETTLQNVILMEHFILSIYRSHKPSVKFDGSTECLTLTESDIDDINKYIYEYTTT
ncbi:hypothetical protein KAU11_09640 [Candidatus Babeliales bacterium]|nr:hypothetical protein [Candidatus Babeliales bacterium]